MRENPAFEKLLEQEEKFTQIRTEYWLNHDLGTWQWWLLIVMLIVPWVIWWKLVDKKRLKESLILGFLIMITAIVLDQIGSEFNTWDYPHRIIPVYPQFVPVNLSILPVSYMLLQQYFPTWRTYVKALIVMAFVFAFGFETVLVWLDMYHLLEWRHVYSFPIYFLLGIVMRWFVLKINIIAHTANCKESKDKL